MPLFVLRYSETPGARPAAKAARGAHLDYLRQSGATQLAGGYADAAAGGLVILEAADRAAAEAFAAADPYVQAGVVERVEVRAYRATIGQLNPARPPQGQRLCALAELDDPGSKGFRFRAGGALFAGFLVRKGGLVAGYVDSCPHAGWPLSPYDVQFLTRSGEHILCAGHGALFEPADGRCVAGPCGEARLTRWPVEVRDGDVFTA